MFRVYFGSGGFVSCYFGCIFLLNGEPTFIFLKGVLGGFVSCAQLLCLDSLVDLLLCLHICMYAFMFLGQISYFEILMSACMFDLCTNFFLYVIFDASVYFELSVLISIQGYGLSESH